MTSMGMEMDDGVKGVDHETAGKIFTTDHRVDADDDNYGQFATVDAALPKGTIDPVYEAKARVLNNAVSKIILARDHADSF